MKKTHQNLIYALNSSIVELFTNHIPEGKIVSTSHIGTLLNYSLWIYYLNKQHENERYIKGVRLGILQ